MAFDMIQCTVWVSITSTVSCDVMQARHLVCLSASCVVLDKVKGCVAQYVCYHIELDLSPSPDFQLM